MFIHRIAESVSDAPGKSLAAAGTGVATAKLGQALSALESAQGVIGAVATLFGALTAILVFICWVPKGIRRVVRLWVTLRTLVATGKLPPADADDA